MNMRDNNDQQKFDQDQEQEWKEQHKGWFACPYCGKTTKELVTCCGERHGEQIEAKEWKEMMAEKESYFPFTEQFKQFVKSHEADHDKR